MTDDTCGQDPKADRIRFDPKADPRQDPKAQQSGTGISKDPKDLTLTKTISQNKSLVMRNKVVG